MTDATYKDTQLLSNNEWCAAASGKTLDVVNPATGKVIGKVAHASIPDLDRALAPALACLLAWQVMPSPSPLKIRTCCRSRWKSACCGLTSPPRPRLRCRLAASRIQAMEAYLVTKAVSVMAV